MRITTKLTTPIAIGIAAAILMAVRLLLPVPVGMADNNDGDRLLCMVGADARVMHNPHTLPYWRYVVFRYPYVPPVHHCVPYPSTMHFPARLAAVVHRHALGLTGAIDLRELTVEYCVLVGFVMWAAARLTRSLRAPVRAIFLTAFFLVLAESTFADYAASPYTETAALWGLMVFAVAGVAAMVPHRRRRVAYVVAWLAALVAIGAKVETLTLILPFAVFFVALKAAPRRVTAAVVVSLLAVVAWQVDALARDGRPDKDDNARNELTATIMPLSDNPAAVAEGLGLPRSFGAYAGTEVWSPHPIQDDPRFNAERVTLPALSGYLLGHPTLTARILASGSGPYLRFRTDSYIGSYTKADSLGQVRRADDRVAVVSWISNRLAFVGFTGIVAYWLACFGAAVLLWRRSAKETLRRALAAVALVLITSAVLQYLTAVFGDGNEVTKHLVVGLLAATLAPVWLLAAAFAPGYIPGYIRNGANERVPATAAESIAENASPSTVLV